MGIEGEVDRREWDVSQETGGRALKREGTMIQI